MSTSSSSQSARDTLQNTLDNLKAIQMVEASTSILTRCRFADTSTVDSYVTTLGDHVNDMLFTLGELSTVVKGLAVQLTYKRNMLLNINALPNEVLCQIFEDATEGSIPQNMIISQTCSHWRTLSLGSANLWRCFRIGRYDPPQLFSFFLDRSCDFPVSIQHHCMSKFHRYRQPYQDHIHHIRELDISYEITSPGDTDFIDFRYWLLCTKAPKLRQLRLSFDNFYTELVIPHLFWRSTLEELSLKNCRLHWAPSTYSGLRKLHINAIEGFQHSKDVDILYIFVDSPNLEEVLLSVPSHWIPPSSAEPPALDITSPGLIPMRYLRRLSLLLSYHETIRILTRIQTMPFLTLYCEYADTWQGIPNVNHLQYIPENPEGFPMFNTLQTLFIYHDPIKRQAGISGAATTASEEDILRVDLSGIFPMPTRRLLSLLSNYSLASIRELSILWPVHSGEEDELFSLLDHTTAITRLTLSSCSPVLWSMLADAVEGSISLLVPTLEELVVECTHIDDQFIRFITELQYAPSLRSVSLNRCKFENEAEYLHIRAWLQERITGHVEIIDSSVVLTTVM